MDEYALFNLHYSVQLLISTEAAAPESEEKVNYGTGITRTDIEL
jgi:hypothetical protein